MEVIGKEIAEKEITAWLDVMDIPIEKRSDPDIKDCIDLLIKNICEGNLIFKDSECITQKLKYPLGDATKEIEYDFRYEIGEYRKATNGISVNDAVDYVTSRLSLISVKKYPKSVFEKMKRADYNVASKLTVFF